MMKKGKRQLNVGGLMIIGWKGDVYLILQSTELRAQTGEGVLPRDRRPIRDKGVFRQKSKGDEARDRY